MSASRRDPVPTPPQEQPNTTSANPNPGMSMLLRMIWMMMGGVALIFCLFSIAKARPQFLSLADAFFWVAAVLMICARYLDVRFFHGTTTSGEPATMRDFAAYVIFIVLGGGACWGLAHVVSKLGIM